MNSKKNSNTMEKRGSGSAIPPASSIGSLIYTDILTGKSYPAWLVTAVDELILKVRKKDIWQIVEFCLEIWAKKNPKEYKKFMQMQTEYRKQRKNKYASTDSKWLRELVNVPREFKYLITKIAQHRIDEYGEHKFWRDFSRKYPGFRNYDTF